MFAATPSYAIALYFYVLKTVLYFPTTSLEPCSAKQEKVYIKTKLSNTWLDTTQEYYLWKKTPEFIKWRKKQFLKQGGLCWYCQDFLPMTKQNVEHKTARSLGGRNNKNNLVISCSGCNKAKGSKPLSCLDRQKFNKQNQNLKGTYLKNKEHFSNVYEQYSDDNLCDVLGNL
jgi:5-methylcytosine-specific restriction endonuclease McrA